MLLFVCLSLYISFLWGYICVCLHFCLSSLLSFFPSFSFLLSHSPFSLFLLSSFSLFVFYLHMLLLFPLSLRFFSCLSPFYVLFLNSFPSPSVPSFLTLFFRFSCCIVSFKKCLPFFLFPFFFLSLLSPSSSSPSFTCPHAPPPRPPLPSHLILLLTSSRLFPLLSYAASRPSTPVTCPPTPSSPSCWCQS